MQTLTRRGILLAALASPFGAIGVAQAASWVDLGVRRVSLTREVDQIAVASSRRFFKRLRLSVQGSDIFLHRVTVHFANDTATSYRFDALVRDGRTTSSIDLPGEGRRIKRVDLAYRRTQRGGTAIVTLQGLPI